MTPAHVLILIGLGLLLGQRVPLDLKLPLRVFGPVSLIALAVTTAPWMGGIHPPVLSAITMGIAILVALGKPLPWVVSGVVCAAAAIGIGLDSSVETGTGWQIAKTLAGTWLTMNAIVCYLAICASHGADKPWARTGIRIIGSWIVAIAVLLLAFSLRK
jgi:hydrogenase/urease accessory protein HupE